MEAALPIVSILAVVCGVVAFLQWRRGTKLFEQSVRLRNEAEAARTQAAELQVRYEQAKLEAERAEKLFEQSRSVFQAAASEAISKANTQFLQLAGERFENAGQKFEAGQKQIEQLLKPMRESIEKHSVWLREIEKQRGEAYGLLREQVRVLAGDQKLLQSETRNLVNALRRPEVRGRWGEMQLRRLLELAGLSEHRDYQEQKSVDTEQGRLRPDFTVFLPNERSIVIDIKTNIDAYLSATETADESDRKRHLQHHLKQVEAAVENLRSKAYQDALPDTVDFVVMFIPGESFLYAAVEQRPDLIEWAMDQKVVIATPTTLLALLKAVALGWREERLAETAQKVSEQGALVHERLCTFANHLVRLGARIDSMVKQYDAAVGSLDSSVTPAVRKLEELHVKTAKQWPEKDLSQRKVTTRAVKSIATVEPADDSNPAPALLADASAGSVPETASECSPAPETETGPDG